MRKDSYAIKHMHVPPQCMQLPHVSFPAFTREGRRGRGNTGTGRQGRREAPEKGAEDVATQGPADRGAERHQRGAQRQGRRQGRREAPERGAEDLATQGRADRGAERHQKEASL